MASLVVKKDGSKEPFQAEKIENAIRAAAQRTDLSEERTNELVKQVSAGVLQLAAAKEEIATSEIREKVLGDLDKIEPSVSVAWREYEAKKGE